MDAAACLCHRRTLKQVGIRALGVPPARRGAALWLLFTATAVQSAQPPARPADLPPGYRSDPCATSVESLPVYLPRLLRVTVNGINTRREYLFLQRRCGTVLARVQDLEELRVRTADKPTVAINGDRYLNLNTFDGLTYTLDEPGQALVIEGEPRIFYPTIINLENDRLPRYERQGPGGFLNYGLFTADQFGGTTDRSWTGSATLGLFGEPGVLISDWLGVRQGDFRKNLRLGTTFFRDFPSRTATLRVGDVYTRGGAFGGTTPVGGVQYATNFSTRPFLITTPVEMMEALARRTAVVNLFNAEFGDPESQSRATFLSGLATAPYGPVEIVNIPSYQNGEYTLTLRDSLGRETTVRTPFFFNRGLLRQGLHDFSYEAGLRRVRSDEDDYAGAFGAATHRYGFNAFFTGEAHLEAGESGQAAGLTASSAVPLLGVVTSTVAGSHTDAGSGTGAYGAMALENSYRKFGYVARQECRSPEFRLATAPATANDPLICRSFLSASRMLTAYDSVSLSATTATLRGQADPLAFRLGAVTRRWRGLNLSAFAGYSERPLRDYNFGILASFSLAAVQQWLGQSPAAAAPASLTDPRRVQFNVTAAGGKDREVSALGQASSSARVGEQDVGIQASTALDRRDLKSLAGTWNNRYLTAAAGLSRVEGTEQYTAGAASGIAWLDGGIFATRPLSNSFAVVRMGEEHAGVRVNGYRTDADGDVLIAPLQPYRGNPIVIDGSDLPMNARVGSLNLAVTPRYRSGSVLRPAIRVLRDAIVTVRLRDADGATVPLPPGGYATVPGVEDLFPVGEDGAVYVIGLEPRTPVTVHWNGQTCTLDIELPPAPARDTIPELGPMICEGVAP